MKLNPRTGNVRLALSLRQVANLLPQELHLDMARRDAHLLRAPAELPERKHVGAFRSLFGIVEARYITEAEKDVWEAVLACVSMLAGIEQLKILTMVYSSS
jgi:hypothetical protein